eukprot:jgi/Botrbrau1/9268/Bobra.180_1s0025.1
MVTQLVDKGSKTSSANQGDSPIIISLVRRGSALIIETDPSWVSSCEVNSNLVIPYDMWAAVYFANHKVSDPNWPSLLSGGLGARLSEVHLDSLGLH